MQEKQALVTRLSSWVSSASLKQELGCCVPTALCKETLSTERDFCPFCVASDAQGDNRGFLLSPLTSCPPAVMPQSCWREGDTF